MRGLTCARLPRPPPARRPLYIWFLLCAFVLAQTSGAICFEFPVFFRPNDQVAGFCSGWLRLFVFFPRKVLPPGTFGCDGCYSHQPAIYAPWPSALQLAHAITSTVPSPPG